ncbi:MAG TPA: hypothetical protein VGD01_03500 [Candidatus Elarobacter sp.]|jgi:hypothetical protein
MIALASALEELPAQGFAALLLLLGIGCIVAALLKGGVKVGGIEFPLLDRKQQWIIGVTGALLLTAACAVALFPLGTGLHAPTDVLSFDEVGTQAEPGYVPANAYLQQYGISISDVTGGEVVIFSDRSAYQGLAVRAPSSPNVLTQISCDGKPESFTLKLRREAHRVSFRRAGLIASSASGVSHPAWSAEGLTANGRVVGTQSEQLLRNIGQYNHADWREFAIEGPGIAAVRFASDLRLNGHPFAGFCGVLIDDLKIVY